MVPVADSELRRDLWLNQRGNRVFWRASRLHWALAALLVTWLLVFPNVIPVLLYQL